MTLLHLEEIKESFNDCERRGKKQEDYEEGTIKDYVVELFNVGSSKGDSPEEAVFRCAGLGETSLYLYL
jgi:hypothetical protein